MPKPTKKIKIAYITETSPLNKHAWSGTAHYAFQSLSASVSEVIALGPERPKMIRWFFMLANQLSLRIFKKRIDYRHSIPYAKAFGRIFTQKLNEVDHDIVVVCGGTEYGAYLKTNKPIFYILDRTIAGAINYHNVLSQLWDWSKKQSIATDQLAMQKASRIFFSSRWAAEQAIHSYNIPVEKSSILPFGANMDELPKHEEIKINIENRNLAAACQLLFIGTSWKNKGADIAVDAINRLNEQGINASLTIVGCVPPDDFAHPKVRIIPFVDKNSIQGLDTLKGLFLTHHFFILPTRFDCTPIVFCESSAYGLPILSCLTGGVEGHVSEGVNGHLFDYHANGQPYAEKICSYIQHPDSYSSLCFSTRNLFEQSLNWNRWANTFLEEIQPFIEIDE